MKSIRRNIFETNSSSTHSLTICSRADFEDWKKGVLVFRRHQDQFVPIDEAIDEVKERVRKIDPENKGEVRDILRNYGFLTYDQWGDSEYLETFEQSYTTEHGDEIVAFGKYGYDG